MKYRALTATGDYAFGNTPLFYKDSPEAVAQAILTRLRLATGEWFLDTTEGTPYREQILGYQRNGAADLAVQARILETPGVTGITSYSSSISPERKFTVAAVVATEYGSTSITLEF